MNGYKLLSDTYRQCMADGRFAEEDVKRKIEIYDFFSTCDKEDFCTMVDSSAFNDIIVAYARKAARNAELGEEAEKMVAGELRSLFHGRNASDVLKEV